MTTFPHTLQFEIGFALPFGSMSDFVPFKCIQALQRCHPRGLSRADGTLQNIMLSLERFVNDVLLNTTSEKQNIDKLQKGNKEV